MDPWTAGVIYGIVLTLCVGTVLLVMAVAGVFRRPLDEKWVWAVVACIALAAVVESV